MAKNHAPYVLLGKHLTSVRNEAKKSLAEVSGAIEIDEKQLKEYEEGFKRPDEELMLLLISYYNMADQEALHMWDLAKYDSDLSDHLEIKKSDQTDNNLKQFSKPMLMLLAMEVRTLYSDGVEISWNESGLSFNFTQSNQGNKQQPPTSIAKVGMSYNQAEKVYKCLQSALLHAKYAQKIKRIPPGKNNLDNKS